MGDVDLVGGTDIYVAPPTDLINTHDLSIESLFSTLSIQKLTNVASNTLQHNILVESLLSTIMVENKSNNNLRVDSRQNSIEIETI